MKKFLSFLFILFVFLFSCTVPSEKKSAAINPSEFPLSPSDPRAKLTLDPGMYKALNIALPTNGVKSAVQKKTDILAYDPKSKKKSVLKSDLFMNSGFAKIDPRQGISLSKFSDIDKVIIGSDDRQKITDTAASSICRVMVKLYMNFPYGGYMASGVMIGPKTVLTAGHCVFGFDENGNGYWANSIEVIPAMSGDYMPFGDAWGTIFMTTSEWAVNRDFSYDWAVIELDRNIGNYSGWSGFAVVSDKSELLNQLVRSFGYPGDKDYGMYMYTDYDLVIGMDDRMINYNIDIMPGQSGSPIYLCSDYCYIRAIATCTAGGHNYGPFLGYDPFNAIVQFIREHASDPVIW